MKFVKICENLMKNFQQKKPKKSSKICIIHKFTLPNTTIILNK